MGQITPKCQGCERLMNALDPLCKSCKNQNHYKTRKNDFEIPPIKINKNKRYDGYMPTTYLIDESLYPKYILNKAYDSVLAKQVLNSIYGKKKETGMKLPKIVKVIFNDPATIIKWADGTKTVVKAENEVFDPEKGLAMAIAKKALGNQGNYYEVFKKWIPEEPKAETCANYDNETLPYAENKTDCDGNCIKCCPVDSNNKRKAGYICKEKCSIYRNHFTTK